MKNLLLCISTLLIISGLNSSLTAQPQYYNYNTSSGSSNSFPFGISGGKEVQLLYLPGAFNQPAAPVSMEVACATRAGGGRRYPLDLSAGCRYFVFAGKRHGAGRCLGYLPGAKPSHGGGKSQLRRRAFLHPSRVRLYQAFPGAPDLWRLQPVWLRYGQSGDQRVVRGFAGVQRFFPERRRGQRLFPDRGPSSLRHPPPLGVQPMERCGLLLDGLS